MAYQDPRLPDPGFGRNPPRGVGMESIFLLAVLAAVILGVLFYSPDNPSGTTAGNPPPATTGQGGASVDPPDSPRILPAPVARPTTRLPPIDQNVPAEKIAPPIPTEPRN